MRYLELLAPARTTEIGIAAIDCGTDAVYIAGPAFGARAAAGNPVEDIARLCSYAHRFGVRIYVTLNTILYDSELEEAAGLIKELVDAGADAIIVQDPAVMALGGDAPVYHASTQCAIRTPEKAAFMESLGFGRLILERQLSLDEIRAIRAATDAELEFFVHGALCMSYSGQCYLSEKLTGRSANRGSCIQACRSLYDLYDASGKLLSKRRAFLSLKDLMLLDRLEDLAEVGVDSFKIEGRLKNGSYVRSVVKSYSAALDALVKKYPDKYCRASFGHSSAGGPAPLEKTFNRGYTQLYIDGKKGKWASLDTPKSMGELIGTVDGLSRKEGLTRISVKPAAPGLRLCNGDGFAFVRSDGGIGGFRGFRCSGLEIDCRGAEGLEKGMQLYRNLSTEFERSVAAEKAVREIPVTIDFSTSPEMTNMSSRPSSEGPRGEISLTATSEDGRRVSLTRSLEGAEVALNPERMESIVRTQLGKRSSCYVFSVGTISGTLPLLSAAFLNGIRRDLADLLDATPVQPIPLRKGVRSPKAIPSSLDYKANIANHITEDIYKDLGSAVTELAYELSHRQGAELMRSRYCLRKELGLCPSRDPLFLKNNGRTLRLDFDCKSCEMIVR